MYLAVNGTLMRGLELNQNLLDTGANFVKETQTEAAYRLFSINDIHPAMYRVAEAGQAIAVEVWDTTESGLVSVLSKEPPGLCIGKVTLGDGSVVLGVLGESIICDGMRDITEFGGWRAYINSR